MFHCPKCNHLIKSGTKFCPHCGYQINYQRPQAPTNHPAYYSKPRHHGCAYGCGTFLAIIIILIGGAFYFYSTPKGHDATQQTISKVTHHSNKTVNNGSDSDTNHSQRHGLVSKLFHHDSNNYTDHNLPGDTPTIMPANVRGTWYSYDNGKLDTLTIGKNSYTDSEDGQTITLHPRSKHFKGNVMKMAKHKTWGVANYATCRGLHFIEIRGWNQSAGDGVSFAEFDHKGTITLDEAGGAGFSTDANYFRTKALAKLFKKKVFKDAGETSDM